MRRAATCEHYVPTRPANYNSWESRKPRSRPNGPDKMWPSNPLTRSSVRFVPARTSLWLAVRMRAVGGDSPVETYESTDARLRCGLPTRHLLAQFEAQTQGTRSEPDNSRRSPSPVGLGRPHQVHRLPGRRSGCRVIDRRPRRASRDWTKSTGGRFQAVVPWKHLSLDLPISQSIRSTRNGNPLEWARS